MSSCGLYIKELPYADSKREEKRVEIMIKNNPVVISYLTKEEEKSFSDSIARSKKNKKRPSDNWIIKRIIRAKMMNGNDACSIGNNNKRKKISYQYRKKNLILREETIEVYFPSRKKKYEIFCKAYIPSDGSFIYLDNSENIFYTYPESYAEEK